MRYFIISKENIMSKMGQYILEQEELAAEYEFYRAQKYASQYRYMNRVNQYEEIQNSYTEYEEENYPIDTTY